MSSPVLLRSRIKACLVRLFKKNGKSRTISVSDPYYRLIVSSNKPANVLQPIIDQDTSVGNSSETKIVSTAKTIPSTGWFVQIELPEEEAFMPIRHMETVIYEIALILTLLSSGGVWVSRKTCTEPVGQSDAYHTPNGGGCCRKYARSATKG